MDNTKTVYYKCLQMDTIVNPLKTSVKTVGHAVKHVPDGLRSLSYDGSKQRGVRVNP